MRSVLLQLTIVAFRIWDDALGHDQIFWFKMLHVGIEAQNVV